MSMQLLRAAPYVFNGRAQPGKMHAVREGDRTWCGSGDIAGEILEGERSEVSCKRCIRSLEVHDQSEQWRVQAEQRRAEKEQEDREWWAWYEIYLKTPEWAKRRKLVLQRARGICEGCMSAAPVHVHHLTYKHAGDELLYELVALCTACHQKAHPEKEIDDGWRGND